MARVRMSEQWDGVIKDFERNNPDLIDAVVDWYPVGQMRIVVVLEDGRRLVYEFIGNRTYSYYDPERKEINDEETWRQEFTRRLRKKMEYMGYNRDRLSADSGISLVTISKYLNGKATPSGYNLERICRALKCTVFELTTIE